VIFVDNHARVKYGELFVDGYDKEEFINRFAKDVLASIGDVYRNEAQAALHQGRAFPLQMPTLRKMKEMIISKIHENNHRSAKSLF
jgi:hypothetical protein